MNWDRIEGNWEQFAGNAKAQWGKLSDDPLEVVDEVVVLLRILSGRRPL